MDKQFMGSRAQGKGTRVHLHIISIKSLYLHKSLLSSFLQTCPIISEHGTHMSHPVTRAKEVSGWGLAEGLCPGSFQGCLVVRGGKQSNKRPQASQAHGGLCQVPHPQAPPGAHAHRGLCQDPTPDPHPRPQAAPDAHLLGWEREDR